MLLKRIKRGSVSNTCFNNDTKRLVLTTSVSGSLLSFS